MRILYVITGLGQGGAERVVCDLADRMHEKGNEVKIAYLTGEILTKPTYSNIELIKINLNSFFLLPIAYLKLSKLIKNFSPDVVHAHMVHANILTRLIRITTPIKKLICTAHNTNEGGGIRMLAYRMTHNLADLTTNVSKGAAEAFLAKNAVPEEGIKPIYNGIDLNKFYYRFNAKEKILKELDLNENTFLILAVGRFNEQKDYPNLLNSLALVKNKCNKNFKLIVAGDGELREGIEALIIQLNLEDNVILLGRRNDIPDLMSTVDLFVLSSKYEGFGLVVAEAMACETLVVATDCGGVSEVVGDCGFLVPAKSSEYLAQAIFDVMQMDDKDINNLIYNARLRVESLFCLDKIVDQWVVIYKD